MRVKKTIIPSDQHETEWNHPSGYLQVSVRVDPKLCFAGTCHWNHMQWRHRKTSVSAAAATVRWSQGSLFYLTHHPAASLCPELGLGIALPQIRSLANLCPYSNPLAHTALKSMIWGVWLLITEVISLAFKVRPHPLLNQHFTVRLKLCFQAQLPFCFLVITRHYVYHQHTTHTHTFHFTFFLVN